VTVTIADSSVLSTIARRFDEAAIPLEELSLRRPSLDEVFLALTGHIAEGELSDEDATEERSRS
jgi:oleandomycin transport system ATP-binding protein